MQMAVTSALRVSRKLIKKQPLKRLGKVGDCTSRRCCMRAAFMSFGRGCIACDLIARPKRPPAVIPATRPSHMPHVPPRPLTSTFSPTSAVSGASVSSHHLIESGMGIGMGSGPPPPPPLLLLAQYGTSSRSSREVGAGRGTGKSRRRPISPCAASALWRS